MPQINLALVALLLFSFSCKKSGGGDSDAMVQTSSGSDEIMDEDKSTLWDENNNAVPADGVPALAESFETNVTLVDFTVEQETKYQKAIEILKKVVSTEEFMNKVLNHTYNNQKTYVDNRGLTNLQIYQKILEGAETLQPAKNNIMDVEVELYFASTSTIGYTYASSKRIWVNTKYFNTYRPSSVAANLMHEWLHKLGFKHATNYSVSRDYSVPYAVGKMVRTLGEQLE